jgi:DNA-binding XRE family transcriptional regulator
MKVYKARDIAVEKLGEERVREIERQARAELAKEHLEANLRAVREMAGKTQVELAREAGISQAELSRNESAGDHLVSTLRRYVEALGGELEILARFGDKTVKLRGV